MTWATWTAGVASCSSAVLTLPVRRPLARAISSSVRCGVPAMSTEIAPLYVFVPVAQPEPEAAESVT